jgi:hypothetical protein
VADGQKQHDRDHMSDWGTGVRHRLHCNFYISQQATRKLGIIGKDFPSVQTAGVNDEPQTDQASCGRSKHFSAPETPPEMPFEPAPDNVGKMK